MTALADYILERVPQSTDGGLLPLGTTTTAIAAATKDASAVVSLGFTFPFDDAEYTQIRLTSDGAAWLAGWGAPSPQYRNQDFDTANAGVILAPWWDYLITSTAGYVRYETRGSSPNGRFVAEWDCWAYWNHSAGHHTRITFQLVLRESGAIEFRYGVNTETGTPSYATNNATVGVKVDTTGTIAGNIREFSELIGTPIANGGIDTPAVAEFLSAEPGEEWPGDATNSIAGAAFNWHFGPPSDGSAAAAVPYATPSTRRTPAPATDATYPAALLDLFPRGDRLWRALTGTRLYSVAAALAVEVKRIHNRVLDVLSEGDPATADETINDWEELLGLPRDGYAPTALADRRAAAWAAYTAYGGGSADYLVELAARHGYTITIERQGPQPFRCGESACDEPIRGEAWCWSFTINASTADADGLEALIARVAPSEAIPWYVYT